jgi:hypothetical protein
MRHSIIGLAVLAIISAAAIGQEPVTIKIALPREGQSIKVWIEERNLVKSTLTAMGQSQVMEDTKTKSFVYIDQILDNPKNERHAVRLNRTYERAVIGSGGNLKTLSLEGKKVLIEKKGDRYTFSIGGVGLLGESQMLLDSEFNKPDSKDPHDLLLPNKPVRPGESWKIDTSELLKTMGPHVTAIDKQKLTASTTLTKTYNKEGKLFGQIDFVMEAPITSLGEDSPFTLKEGRMSVKAVADGCIGGTSPTEKMTTTISLRVTGASRGTELRLEIDGSEKRTMELLVR